MVSPQGRPGKFPHSQVSRSCPELAKRRSDNANFWTTRRVRYPLIRQRGCSGARFHSGYLPHLKIALAGIAASITAGAFAVGVKDLLKFALSHPIILAIAAAVVLAVILILAAWAPADLIIEDSLGFTLSDLDALTNTDLPLPEIAQYVSQQGIKVKATPLAHPVKR